MTDMLIKVRPISMDEAQQNPDVFQERIEEAVKEFLDKYGYEFKIEEFIWAGGPPSATIRIVKKPE